MGAGDNFTYSCQYDASENKTFIELESYIINDTIYAIDTVTICVNLYLNNNLVEEESKITRNFHVNNGQLKNFTFKCYYSGGEVNRLEYVWWGCTYKTLWDSYKPWFIASIVIASVTLLVFILIMFILDLELDDVVDFIKDHRWSSLMVLTTFIPYVITGILTGSWSWVPIVILSSAAATVVVLGLIAFGIKHLID